ncbi:hypothetical protein [Liquorilactobacillus uvarum]|uniref:hypothetical protein n=1 Tax=Liquorilactobacillus uvarum TaxID=303240 RepID=UPI00288AD0EB|nr:hypothetical protein [Liquorilactobacillus uvarum]
MSRRSHKTIWLMVLLIDILLTMMAIFTHNILGCVMLIIFSVTINKKGSPILFSKYNQRIKEKRLAVDKYLRDKKTNK